MKFLTQILCVSMLFVATGCDSDGDDDTTPSAGEMTAGEMAAGEMTAGEMTAGEMMMSLITAEELAALISAPGRILTESVSAYCDQCGDSDICEEEIGFGPMLDATQAECVIAESNAEEMAALVEFGECQRMVFAQFEMCVSAIMMCDEMSLSRCFEVVDEQEDSACPSLDDRYGARIGVACFDEEPPHECGDGSMLPGDAVCDGYEDCEDGSDEAGECEISTFECTDGSMSIESVYQCDGYADCADISDERDCDIIWECADGDGEHDSMQICDGVEDCADGSDEGDCANAE